jgi:putative two-component system response regulator
MFSLLEKVTPNLILLDIEMPDLNGYEALKQLKADDRFAYIPVVFLTGNTDEVSELEGFELGAADYIAKPFTVMQLINRVSSQLLIAQHKKES